ncbi:hypothetical protein D9M71_357440 [compost metagenome]
MVEAASLLRADAPAVVALAVEGGQRLAVLGQAGEHVLAAFDVGLAALGVHRVDAERPERMPLGSDQPPAAVALLAAEEPAGLERRAAEQTAEAIVAGRVALPLLQLHAFGLPGGGQLFGALDLFRPVATAGLAEAVDDSAIGLLQLTAAGTGAEAADEDVLGRLRLAQVDLHRTHLAALQLAADPRRQQHALAAEIDRHRYACAHAEHFRRGRPQRHQQGLRRAGR